MPPGSAAPHHHHHSHGKRRRLALPTLLIAAALLVGTWSFLFQHGRVAVANRPTPHDDGQDADGHGHVSSRAATADDVITRPKRIVPSPPSTPLATATPPVPSAVNLTWLDCFKAQVCGGTLDKPGKKTFRADASHLKRCVEMIAQAAADSGGPAEPVFARRKFKPSATRPVLRVACVGDSITYGNGTHVGRKERDHEGSYPLELQALVDAGEPRRGKGMYKRPSEEQAPVQALLLNYAKSGRTAGDVPDKFSFRRSSEFKASLKSAPHIVIIMLGTNDSKPRSWRDAATFIEDIKFIIDHYRALPTKPYIVILAPPPALSALGRIRAKVIADEEVPALRKFASENGMWFVDLHGAFMTLLRRTTERPTAKPELWPRHRRQDDVHAPGSEWFHDGVHPTVKGHSFMARTVFESMCDGLLPSTALENLAADEGYVADEEAPFRQLEDA